MRKAILIATAAAAVAGFVLPAHAADVTPQRLLNSKAEPQNWLMNMGSYDSWRYSTLRAINRSNVADLRPVFQFSVGGWINTQVDYDPGFYGQAREQGIPLVDDGFMYAHDGLNRVMKMDVRSGHMAEMIWHFDPEATRNRTSRGIALLNNSVYVATNDMRLINVDRDTGEALWDIDITATMDPATGTPSPDTQQITAAPMTVRGASGRELVLQGESSGGTRGTRSWVGAWDAADGEFIWRFFTIPAPGEQGHETWKNDAWRTGGGGVWTPPTFDPITNVGIYGTGDCFPSYDPEYRPGDNLFCASTIAVDVDTGALTWYFQAVPNERWDLDTINTRILYTLENGRRVVSNFERQGYWYQFDVDQSAEAGYGAFIRAEPYVDNINWTTGIDPKSGLPLDYDPNLDVQLYQEGLPRDRLGTGALHCPSWGQATAKHPSSYDPVRRLTYGYANTDCTMGNAMISVPELDDNGFLGIRGCCWKGQGTVSNPATIVAFEVDSGKRVLMASFDDSLNAGMLSTAGDLLFVPHAGRMVAYDADTLAELWSYHTGTGHAAPAITYAVNGRQYVAVNSGSSRSDGGFFGSNNVIVFGLGN